LDSTVTHFPIANLRIAISCVGFPIQSETFILNQIVDLIDKGHHVDIFPYVKCESDNPHAKYVEYGLSDKTFPSGPTPFSFLTRIKIYILFAIHNPSKIINLIKLLNFLKFGKSALNLTLFMSAKPYLERAPYDIYHGHFGESGVALVKLKKAGVIKGKIITTFHGYDAHFTPQDIEQKRIFYSELFREGNWFTTNSEYTSKKIIELGCSRDYIVKIPVGLNIHQFHTFSSVKFLTDTLKILSVGRLIPFKGQQYGIEAIIHLLTLGYYNIEYMIVGTGELENELQSMIEKNNLQNLVFLLGNKSQEEIIRLMNESHVLLHPSITSKDGRQENQGLVIQEAQAMEMAVIATRTGGIADGVIENESAFLVEEKNALALAEAIKQFIENKELISRFGKVGREYVEQNFDIRKLNDQLEEIYFS
jgi:colanic acid/amylovoran biosynthesis glycosyltransferase